MKARETDTVAALRTAIAAIDNAESVAGGDVSATTDGPFAKSAEGVGATEVARRQLSAADIAEVLGRHVHEYLSNAEDYDAMGRHEAAGQLRRQAAVVSRHL